MATGAPSSTGERVLGGRYRLVSHIADGGMATVHLAIDERLGRRVAVKILRPDLARDAAFVLRFRREAQLAAGLSHPNIVAIHDFEERSGELFLVMEYVDGRTLRDRLTREGAMSVREAVRVFSAVLAALAAAHRAGLVHRDVKPENVLLRPDGTVKVTDFGLARSVTSSTRTSTTGVLLGTVSYLAPEQLDGDRADERSDVYAAGLILYELLTGQKAFSGSNPMHVAYQHVHGSVPLASDRVATVPLELDRLIGRATAKDPAERIADGGALQRELRAAVALLSDEELDATPHFLAGPPVPDAPQEGTREDAQERDQNALQRDEGARERDEAAPDAAKDDEVAAETADGVSPASSGPPALPAVTQRIPTEATRAVAVARPAEGQAALPEASPDEHSRPARTTHRKRSRRRGILVTLLVLALVAGGGAGGWWWYDTNGPGSLRVVPSLQHLSRADAESALARVDLQASVTEAFDETEPHDQVIQADAAPGTELHKRSTVALVVSKGPERFLVPTVTGQPRTEVERLLADRSLTLGKVEEAFHDTIAAGVVISQEPAKDASVKRGTSVSIVVSKGRQPIPVPTFVGKSADEATKALTALGLKVTVGEAVNHEQIPAGAVVNQTPAEGTLFKGDVVTIVPSKGPVLIAVPNVVLKKQKDAEQALAAAGFQVKIITVFGGALKTVRFQDPAPGTLLRRGSVITLTII